MSVPTLTMRAALKTVYKGRRWIAKVNKMSDEQVVAIYTRLQRQHKL
jgi:hypothetical protein